jgi:hypothetical protein
VIRRHLVLIVAATALVLFVWCIWLWQPARQIERHTRNLLETIEDKDWREMAGIMADDYSDRWGHDKGAVVDRSKQAFAQFFILTVEGSEYEVEEANAVGTARVRIAITGRGGPLADIVMTRASELRQPFSFTWRQASWKPWDWKLIRVDQPELEVTEY